MGLPSWKAGNGRGNTTWRQVRIEERETPLRQWKKTLPHQEDATKLSCETYRIFLKPFPRFEGPVAVVYKGVPAVKVI